MIITHPSSKDPKNNSFSKSQKKPYNKSAPFKTFSLIIERISFKNSTEVKMITPSTEIGPFTKSASLIWEDIYS